MASDTTEQPGYRAQHDLFAPFASEKLSVGQGHEIYVESVGQKNGIPAVYLHGGPGSGCQPEHRKLFEPEKFHAVLFDQRGAGRSTPKGNLYANTLWHLVADMELIRAKLGFERWVVVGGSWGATLALAYAQTHPERVLGLVLRATFLGTYAELEDVFCNILPRHYPALNRDFLNLLSIDERNAPLESYWRRILSTDPQLSVPASRSWQQTESILSEVSPKAKLQNPMHYQSLRKNLLE